MLVFAEVSSMKTRQDESSTGRKKGAFGGDDPGTRGRGGRTPVRLIVRACVFVF
jgi:hypothetical protein